MMNHYPWWKNLLILGIVLVAAVYTLPNLYPDDPAIQISQTKGTLGKGIQARVQNVLKNAEITPKRIERAPNRLLIRFRDTEAQLKAKDLISDALGNNYVVALNLAPATPGWLRAINASPMNLGLDLRGGVHFLLQVDMNAAVQKALDRFQEDFGNLLRDQDIRYTGISVGAGGVSVKFGTAESRDRALDVLSDQYGDRMAFDTSESGGTYVLTGTLTESALNESRRFAVEQNITTLRNRVNELGVAEPVIQQQGKTQVVVELPGVQDTARAKEILGATATLEFRMVDEQGNPYAAEQSGRIPLGDELYHDRRGNPVLLKRRVMLTGDYITDASSGIDSETNGPAVFITLDGEGARLFSTATAQNVGKLMAVVFIQTTPETVVRNGKKVQVPRTTEEVINIARIQEQLGRRFQITGLDSTREARDLALLLRAGALAAPMTIVEERTIGPSLGAQNIEQGYKSVVLGFILVVAYMAIYYRLFGVFADIALLANLVLLVGIMSIVPGLTLTLPGIAGIVLTMGMAVDANVLINERIREELKNGNSPQASIQAGYTRAFATIVDSHVTTLIAAIVLFAFGTGPVKGFAVTLTIGLACSMFTAIMGTRALVNLIYGGRRQPQLSI
ncbi:MAG TPA: protein translocase subunit SecD [Gammaproteobacteria bacterium]|nr:protein translocase subunit SecD [Gammaproteobacteria bacterium]